MLRGNPMFRIFYCLLLSVCIFTPPSEPLPPYFVSGVLFFIVHIPLSQRLTCTALLMLFPWTPVVSHLCLVGVRILVSQKNDLGLLHFFRISLHLSIGWQHGKYTILLGPAG